VPWVIEVAKHLPTEQALGSSRQGREGSGLLIWTQGVKLRPGQRKLTFVDTNIKRHAEMNVCLQHNHRTGKIQRFTTNLGKKVCA
jgi:hypothetical protein